MPQVFTEKNASRQYIFGDFILRSDGVLLHQNRVVHIPPKELKVLILLLEANGDVVSKEQIFDQVWYKMAASDESLTRCIYALRRILRESKNDRHIETIYGRGYRFKSQVALISHEEEHKKVTSIAVFPFKMLSVIDDSLLHNGLVQGLSRYACFGLNILPASVTKDCTEFAIIDKFVHQLQPDYYFTGQITPDGSGWRLFIELVQACDHKLIEHQSVEFEPDMPISLLLTRMINLLMEKLPNIQLKNSRLQQMSSIDTAVACLNGRREMYKHTPASLQRALGIFRECINTQPQHALPYCSLAECYISLAQLGLYDQQQTIECAMKAIDKAIEIDPRNAQALGMLALLSGLKGESCVASVLFKQAHLLMPESSDVYYYHALFHFLKGNTEKSLKYVEKCIKLDPNRIGSSILMLWVTYYSSSLDEAIEQASSLMSRHTNNHPILLSMMALFMALKGKRERAEQLLARVPEQKFQGYLAVNNLYTQYLLYGRSVRSKIIEFLRDVDFSKIRGSLLPLILIAHGRKELEEYWTQLQVENNIWSNIWRQDPRLSGFKELFTRKDANEQAA